MSIIGLLTLILIGALLVGRIEGRRTGERRAGLVMGLYAWLLLAIPMGLITAPAVTIAAILAGLVLLIVAGLLRAAYRGLRGAVKRALGPVAARAQV